MPNAHEMLSYTVSADDKASAVFRGVGAEITKLANLGNTGLSGLSKNMASLSSKKPLEFVKAEQAVQIAQTEAQMAKLTKTTTLAGNATKLQAAEMGLLTQRHKQLQGEMALTEGSHVRLSKAATVASVGILAAGVAVVAGSIKQAVTWEKLGKTIEQQTGLSGKSMKDLMSTINNMTGHVPYKLNEVSQAAVILKQSFHETGPEIEKTAPAMIAFAKRAGQEVTPAVQGLSNVLLQYRKPLSDVTMLTDKLVGVSQLTQQPLGAMESTIERFGPKLQAMGFGLNESIRLMGVLGESGVKAEQMGRGLSAAYTLAQKQLGVTAANPHGNPQELLDKEGLALKKAEDAVTKYNESTPKTLAAQNNLDRQRVLASEHLDLQRHKYDELKKSIDAAGGSHATVSTVIQGEIKGIEHAKSSTEAYSLAASAFGKMVGPAFARAFYNNKTAIEATDAAMKKHGETQALVKREEESLGGKVTELDETWHKTERTLGNDLVPTLSEFLKLVQGGTTDIEKFVKGNASLAEALGAVAMVGSVGFLARKPIVSAAKDIGGIVSKVTGIGGGGAGSGETWGVRGPIKPGSLANPTAVTMVGSGGSPIPGGGSAKTAEEDTKGMLAKFAEQHPYIAAGGQGAIALAVGAAIPLASAAAINAVAEAIHPGMTKEHSPPEVNKLLLGGQPLGAGQVGAPGIVEAHGINQADAHRIVENTKAQVEANKLLIDSNAKIKQSEEELSTMRQQGETGTKAYQKTLNNLAGAEAEHAKGVRDLTTAEQHNAEMMRTGVEASLVRLDSALAAHPSGSTLAAVMAKYKNLDAIVSGAMQSGYISVAQGTQEINKILSGELKALGIKAPSIKNQAFGPLPGGGGNALQETNTGGGSGFSGLATGGRVPGAVGPDNWTLIDPSGRPAAKVGGSELLIANRHTEAQASQATMAVYGKTLGEMVTGEHTPHSAATGGRFATGGRIVTASEFGGHNDPSAYLHSTASGKIANDSLWGFAELSNPPGSLNFSALGHLPMGSLIDIAYGSRTARRVPKVDVGAGGSGLGGHIRAVDLTYAVAQALGFGGLGDVKIFGAGQGPAGGASGGAAHIKTPKWTGPGGIIGQIGRAVLHRVAAAANAKLAAVHPSSGASGLGTAAGAAPTGGGFAQMGLVPWPTLFAPHEIAGWIVPEVKYAQAHGWHGQITSGYRPGASMHALDVYPGGAVDFGGESDPAGLANREAFLAATAGYTGSKLLKPIGFRDDGHLSGTGHALGGRVGFAGSFGQGGSVTASSPTMAIFGDKGTETATFIPHAATGIRLGSKGLGESVGTNPDTGNIEYHTQEEWAQIRLVHSSQTKHEALYRKAHPKAKKPLSPGKELEEDIRESLGIAKSEPGKDISEAQRVGSSTTATLQKLLTEARKLHSKVLTAKLKGDIEGIVKHTGGMIEKLALENPTEAPAADKSAIAGLQKLMGTATAKGSKALTDTLIGDLLKVAANWQKDIVSKFSKGEAHTTAHENLKIVNESLAQIAGPKGIGSTLPTAATDPAYLAAQQAGKEGEIKELQAEDKVLRDKDRALRVAEAKAKKEHNKKLTAALHAEIVSLQAPIGEVEDAITGAKVDVGNLEIEYKKAMYEAFKKGIAEVDAGLQAHISQIQTGEALEEGQEHREGKDFSGLEELKTKQEGVLTPAQIAQAKSDYAAYKTHHEEQIKVDEEQRQHDIGSLGGLSGEDRSSMERTIEGLATSINTLQNQIYDQGKSTEKLTEATNENTKVLGGSVGLSFNGQQYVAGAGASQSSNSGADIALGI